MGVGVSGWRLARAVAEAGQLGVVSGVGLDALLARRLQLGDPDGHIRRALAHFPFPAVAEGVLARFFVPGGIEAGRPFRPDPPLSLRPSRAAVYATVAANFVEVFLAKEGHRGLVGVNHLEKLQMATPAALYGALLAGVDYVLMGAGIPAAIPGLLDALAGGERGQVPVSVHGQTGAPAAAVVDPAALFGEGSELRRPRFLAIVSSNMLASYLARDPRTRPDGFVVEGPVAGGHNAPPRGRLAFDEEGQPVYGPRDEVDHEKLSTLGLPYWLAGGHASPGRLREAQGLGAAGIQVGSAFALCAESDLDASLKQALIDRWFAGALHVRTDPLASPTGFPFKVAHLPGTVADHDTYARRRRVCDVGYLRVPYRRADGTIGYRCPAEPIRAYTRKGGRIEDTEGRRCLCNGLIAAIGLAQCRPDGTPEPPLVTIGQDLSFLPRLTGPGRSGYGASDVIGYLLGPDHGEAGDGSAAAAAQVVQPD
ncbi:MAG: nitronate monooxygenase [Acidimicrobiales bacterium]